MECLKLKVKKMQRFNDLSSEKQQCLEKTKSKQNSKMSNLPFEDLPDEVILKIMSFLEIKDLIRCGCVSKRLRKIGNDESLWQAINLYEPKSMPVEIVKKVLNNGCSYLSLESVSFNGSANYMDTIFNSGSQLKYLHMNVYR